MRDYEIKFVNKEITPFGGLSLLFKMLEKCHFAEHLDKVAFRFRVPGGGINRFSSYWDCLWVFGAAQAVPGLLTWCVMTLHSAICLAGNVELATGLTSVISTSSHKLSTSVPLANCSVGSSRNCCLTITLWTLTHGNST